jgi:peroxiredoxin
MKQPKYSPALWDVEFPVLKTNTRIFPLSNGAKVQDFQFGKIWNDSASGLTSMQTDNFQNYCKKGIKVISFLTPGWNIYSKSHLERLIQINDEITALGGEICLFVSASTEVDVQHFIKEYEIPFVIGIDNDFSIAKKFGVFDKNHQPWHTVSGISEDGPFPSVFVIRKNSEVANSYVDLSFEKPFSYVGLASWVYEEAKRRFWDSYEQNISAIKH